MSIDVDDMAMFLAVAREGSFGRAASSLLMSQPSVSERMARLERTMGSPLFTRGARGTRLSSAGERLAPYARRILDLMREATGEMHDVDAPPALRVAVHTTFAHRALPLVLAAVADRRVVVRDAHSDEVIGMLLDGVADIGFVLPGARPKPLRFVALPADPVTAVAAPHLVPPGKTVALSALADHRIALNRWGQGAEEFCAALRAAGVPDARLTECSDGHTALRLAVDHEHVALVTASIAADALVRGIVAPLRLTPRPRWSVPLVLAYLARRHDEPAVAEVRGWAAGR